MRGQRILVMMNEYTMPPKNIVDEEVNREQSDWIMQYDVIKHLKLLKFNVELSPLSDDLNALKKRLDEFDPHIVFNLIYEFGGEAILDQNVVSYLELLKVPYTGCNPRSLTLARNKATTKKILHFHQIPTPSFAVFPKGHPIARETHLEYPAIVKCLAEEGSIGIFKTSLVQSDDKLAERVNALHEQYNSDAIVEQFIAGREFSIGILGNSKLQAFPIWELLFENSETPDQEFYHSHAKWNNSYRRRKGIRTQKAELTSSVSSRMTKMGKAVYKALGLNGYARVDFRMTPSGDIYVIEANPNPDLSFDEDFAMSAKAAGMPYETLIKRIVSLGLQTGA